MYEIIIFIIERKIEGEGKGERGRVVDETVAH